MDVVLQQRPPEYGPGRLHPKAALGQGCITVLLLGSVEIGGITAAATVFSAQGLPAAVRCASVDQRQGELQDPGKLVIQ